MEKSGGGQRAAGRVRTGPCHRTHSLGAGPTDLTNTEASCPLGSGCRQPFTEILGWEEGERHTVLSLLLYTPKASI